MPTSHSHEPQWEALGTFIKSRRDEEGLTIQEAAARARPAGMGHVTWSEIEKGRNTNPTDRTLRRIASVIGDLEHIFELAGRPIPKTAPQHGRALAAPEARRHLKELLAGVPTLSPKARDVLVDMFDLVARTA